MSNPDPERRDPADEAPDPAVLRAESRVLMLRELAEMGMELTRMGMERARRAYAAETDPAKGKDPADFFGPSSRAVRLTLAQEAKADAELRDLKAGIVREEKKARKRAARREEAAYEAYEAKVKRLVIQVADREIPDFEVMEGIFEALDERLGEDEAYEDFHERPLRETIERLCHDMDLHPDWSRWNGDGWTKDSPPARPLHSEFIGKQSRIPITWIWPPSDRPGYKRE